MKPEIIVILIFVAIFLIIGGTYFFHGRKIEQEKKKQKSAEQKSEVIEKPIEEEKPAPVGIIKKESIESKEEYDFAPLKEVKTEENKKEQNQKQDIQQEIKNLSPEMKKILMSDLLKPRF